MEYAMTRLRDLVTIRSVVSIHYFEYARGFMFPGERHDFWEFLYVDKGEVEVCADGNRHHLREGGIIFHKPGEFHTVEATGKDAPNLIVMAFSCHSPAMAHFEEKVLRLGDPERDLLARLVREARTAFLSPLHSNAVFRLERRVESPPGAEQIIRQCLEQVLILMIRKEKVLSSVAEIKQAESTLPTPANREQADREVLRKALQYMEGNTHRPLAFEEIRAHLLMGETTLKTLFRRQMGCGVMVCATRIRMEAAKRMIRESGLHFSDIAEQMGWSSVHHFSRQFKRVTGMTPSQYARSAMGRI